MQCVTCVDDVASYGLIRVMSSYSSMIFVNSFVTVNVFIDEMPLTNEFIAFTASPVVLSMIFSDGASTKI